MQLGVLRGAGKQFIGAVANLIAFYAIGLPMAWILCFIFRLGVRGLMMGISFGTFFQVVVLLVLILGFEDYVYSALPTEVKQKMIKFSEDDNDEEVGSQQGGAGGGFITGETKIRFLFPFLMISIVLSILNELGMVSGEEVVSLCGESGDLKMAERRKDISSVTSGPIISVNGNSDTPINSSDLSRDSHLSMWIHEEIGQQINVSNPLMINTQFSGGVEV